MVKMTTFDSTGSALLTFSLKQRAWKLPLIEGGGAFCHVASTLEHAEGK